jgi:CheY-like chemotaxis protein
MTGPEATRRLRDKGFGDLLIVGVTGNIMPEDVKFFLEAGANAVLSKPLNFTALQGILDQHRR